MKIKIIVIAVILLTTGVLSVQAQKPCGCADKEALLNLLNDAEMSIQELEFQDELIEKQEAKAGKSVMATEEQITKSNESLSNAMKLLPSDNYSENSEMDSVDCSLKTMGTSSDCITLVLKHFFEPLQKKCSEKRSPNQPYYDGMDMRSYLVPFMKANYAMRDFIVQMLKSLPKNCRPNGWFGYVYYNKVKTWTTITTYPPTPVGRSSLVSYGGTSTHVQKSTYTGTALVQDGKAASAGGYATTSDDKSSMSSEQALCNTRIGLGTAVLTSGSKLFTEGEAKGEANFTLKVHPANHTYDLSVHFPAVNTTGQNISWSKTTAAGGCKAYESNNTRAATSGVGGTGYVTGAKIKSGSSDYLEESRVIEEPEFNKTFKDGNSSTNITEIIQIRWMLRRLPHK